MDPGAAIQRILERPRIAYIVAVLDTYGRATGGLLANGLAFAALFTAVPIMLLTLGLTGFLAKDAAIQRAVADALEAVVPPLADLIEDTLRSLVSGAALTSVIGLVGTVWGVSQLYVRARRGLLADLERPPRARCLPSDRTRLRVGGDPHRRRDRPDRRDHRVDRPRRARPRDDPGRPIAERVPHRVAGADRRGHRHRRAGLPDRAAAAAGLGRGLAAGRRRRAS